MRRLPHRRRAEGDADALTRFFGTFNFVVGGIGRVRSDQGEGSRIFAEGGGGLSVGPFGVQLAVKFAWNNLTEPVAHRFLTIPVTLRGTLSF